MGCCGSRTATRVYVVSIPGQPTREVTSEQAAIAAVRGIRGASYRPKR